MITQLCLTLHPHRFPPNIFFFIASLYSITLFPSFFIKFYFSPSFIYLFINNRLLILLYSIIFLLSLFFSFFFFIFLVTTNFHSSILITLLISYKFLLRRYEVSVMFFLVSKCLFYILFFVIFFNISFFFSIYSSLILFLSFFMIPSLFYSFNFFFLQAYLFPVFLLFGRSHSLSESLLTVSV